MTMPEMNAQKAAKIFEKARGEIAVYDGEAPEGGYSHDHCGYNSTMEDMREALSALEWSLGDNARLQEIANAMGLERAEQAAQIERLSKERGWRPIAEARKKGGHVLGALIKGGVIFRMENIYYHDGLECWMGIYTDNRFNEATHYLALEALPPAPAGE